MPTVYAGGVSFDLQLPPAEATIDSNLVRALLEEQHPDLAGLPLFDAGEGWDNRTIRLGEDLAVRLPRRAASAPLIEQEQRWLPILAPHLPLPVPKPNPHRPCRMRISLAVERDAMAVW
jgi:aminoglycoside phosphotransferase (APT) family kinase protein